MSRFTGELDVTFSSVRERWARLNEALYWELDHKGSGRFIVVPEGYESDGITVPRALWAIIPPWGHPATRAAMVHDWMLAMGYHRDDCDEQFYLALLAVGVSRPLAWALWAGVRGYGLVAGLNPVSKKMEPTGTSSR